MGDCRDEEPVEHGAPPAPDRAGPCQTWGALSLVDLMTIAGRAVGVAVGPPGYGHGQGVERAVGERGGPVGLGAAGDQVWGTLSVVARQAGQPGKALTNKILCQTQFSFTQHLP